MLPGRTDNEIKNLWNTHIKKKLVKMGIDPATHRPLNQQAPGPVTDESRSGDQLRCHEQEGPAEASSDSGSAGALPSSLWGEDDDTSALMDEMWQFPTSEHSYPTATGLPWDDNEGIWEWLLEEQEIVAADAESETLVGELSTIE